MIKHKLNSCLLLSIIFLTGCDKGPVEVEDKTPGLYARVVDSNNNPVADVKLHYIFYVGINITSRNTVFSYVLQSQDTITMRILDAFDKEVTTLLENEYQPAGNHSYNFNADSITNGVYSCLITGLTINETIKFFVLTDDINQLQPLSPFKETDANGFIYVPYSAFGIGDHFHYQNQMELIISDSITIVLFKEGYNAFTQNIKLDTTQAFEATFLLEEE